MKKRKTNLYYLVLECADTLNAVGKIFAENCVPFYSKVKRIAPVTGTIVFEKVGNAIIERTFVTPFDEVKKLCKQE